MNFHWGGDMASILRKKMSIERISLRPELSAPPCLAHHPDPYRFEEARSLHWGTRSDGL